MTSHTAPATGFDPRVEGFNPFVPGAMLDPYPSYRALRDLDPVHHNPAIGYWFLSRYDDIATLGPDRASLVRGESLSAVFEQYRGTALHRLIGATMFGMDDPAHGRIKQLITRSFTRRRIEALRPRIERICAELLDELALDPGGGTFSLIPRLSYPLPFRVICELLGIAPGERDRFLRWTREVLLVGDPFPAPEVVPRAMAAAVKFEAYVVAVLEERRALLRAGRELPPGLLSDIVEAAEDSPGRISDFELTGLVFTVIVAGFENVTNLIGNTVRALAENPDQARTLREDRSLLANLPDEVLRYYSTTQYNTRQAAADLVLHGRTIPAGDNVILLRGAANRDERKFADPDVFDLRRPDSVHHVGFGEGATFCTGAALARLEVQIALDRLLDRIGEFRITRWEQQPIALMWGPATVEVEYGPVA